MTTVVAALLLGSAAAATDSGAPIEVAAKAEGTRSQTWASVAWAAESKCWLVTWREGYLNEPAKGSDICCARVSAAGKALDPAGIRLTKGPGLKDRPRVVSDGKGFLVVWEDLRNGKDWDVYAARVSAEGKTLDEGGFLVAGGDGNQCRPDVAFAKSNYVAAWMSFENGYGVLCARISPEGKLLDAKGQEAFVFKKGLNYQAINPTLASGGSELIATVDAARSKTNDGDLSIRPLDAATGGAAGAILSFPSNKETFRGSALAAGKEGFLLARCKGADGSRGSFILLARLDKNGAPMDGALTTNQYMDPKSGYIPTPLLRDKPTAKLPVGRAGVAFDGKAYLVVTEQDVKGRQITGWRVSPEGKLLDDAGKGFAIAAEPGRNEILPAVAGGPEGTCLVVYSELRGADDVKVVARIVR
jgi:hypothetical protein